MLIIHSYCCKASVLVYMHVYSHSFLQTDYGFSHLLARMATFDNITKFKVPLRHFVALISELLVYHCTIYSHAITQFPVY